MRIFVLNLFAQGLFCTAVSAGTISFSEAGIPSGGNSTGECVRDVQECRQ